MRAHYDGPVETAKKLAKAEADLKNFHYKNEHSLSFESFINKLNDFFLSSLNKNNCIPRYRR